MVEGRRVFYSEGPTRAKALSPKVLHFVSGTFNL